MSQRIATRRTTLNRRRAMSCKVYQLKIDSSHLSKKVRDHLDRLFLEAKWFYNYCLSDIKEADHTRKIVPVKVGDDFENRELRVLGSHMRQDIKKKIHDSLKSLSTLKSKGYKVGKLKFKGTASTIPLKEHGNSYRIDFSKNRIRFQGLKPWFRVRGLDQIPKGVEFANAVLIRKAGSHFLHITTYQARTKKEAPVRSIGIDFGCETQLTFSNGIKVAFQVKPTERMKRLDRKISKRGGTSSSNNKKKDQLKRQKEFLSLTNRRGDIRNKIVNAITTHFSMVCAQDENIKGWHSGYHGKSVSYSGIGSILSDLKSKSSTYLEADRHFPSTQLCPKCGNRKKLALHERIYSCDNCNFVLDRDIKSAICIEQECLKSLPADRREFTLGEMATAAFLDKLMKINGVRVSKLPSWSQEAVA